MSLDGKISKELATARERAEAGKAGSMETYLRTVQRCAQRVGVDISAQVAEIKKAGYRASVPVELAIARESAEAGKAVSMELDLETAQRYAQEVGVDISAQVAEIKEAGYRASVPVELAIARECTKAGKVVSMEAFLETAQRYAQKVGVDISAQVAEIKKAGYRASVPVELAMAKESAEAGEAFSMELDLEVAQRYAQEVGVDISAQVAEIKEAGYRASVPVQLAIARECVKAGVMERYLGTAQRYAQEVGVDISAQVAEIRALVQK